MTEAAMPAMPATLLTIKTNISWSPSPHYPTLVWSSEQLWAGDRSWVPSHPHPILDSFYGLSLSWRDNGNVATITGAGAVITMILSLVTVLLLTRLSVQYNRSPIIQRVLAPRYVLSGSDTRLMCVYNYHTTPYSVRWYRNGKEFYSYVSDKEHPISVHPGPGLRVDMARSDQSQVSLVSVSPETTGRFRCEVSGQAPMFATDTAFTDLSVVTGPPMGPTITGAEPRYHVRDLVSVNCTLAGSEPVANLTWYINNKEVTCYCRIRTI